MGSTTSGDDVYQMGSRLEPFFDDWLIDSMEGAALRLHDIGLHLRQDEAGEIGFEVMLGGGQGRTPMLAKTIREFLPKAELLSYLESILRPYNQLGRRDNMYKARIKILVHEIGTEA